MFFQTKIQYLNKNKLYIFFFCKSVQIDIIYTHYALNTCGQSEEWHGAKRGVVRCWIRIFWEIDSLFLSIWKEYHHIRTVFCLITNQTEFRFDRKKNYSYQFKWNEKKKFQVAKSFYLRRNKGFYFFISNWRTRVVILTLMPQISQKWRCNSYTRVA